MAVPDHIHWAIVSGLLLLAAVYVSILPPHKKGFLAGRRYRLPPGPPGHPVVGSLPSWLRAKAGGTTFQWLLQQAEQGEMTTLSMGNRTWVLLNTARAANEIISKRASITHERPYFPIAGSLVSRDKRYFLKNTGDWKKGRRLVQQLLMGHGSQDHARVAEEASLGLLRAYLDEPGAWYEHHYRYAVAIMHQIVTGKPLGGKPTADLDDLQRVTSSFLTCIHTSSIDFFPQLARLVPTPFQLWRPHWEKVGAFHYRVIKRWWDGMTRKPDDASTASSFIHDALAAYPSPEEEEEAMYLVLFVMAAGADNPRMTMNAWVMACIAHPQTMRRARHEIDLLCGGSSSARASLRLPVLDDLPRLPYLCAVIKEVLRWRPIVPLIPPRVLVEDLEWEGYRFPAGTEFLVNSIAVCANGYDDPQGFRPERWLTQQVEARLDSTAAEFAGENDGAGIEQDLWQYAFSGGRRMCAGYRLAQKEMFVAFARLLYCFDFAPGAEPVDDRKLNAFQPGEPFPVRVTVRSAEHERLIRDQAAKCANW